MNYLHILSKYQFEYYFNIIKPLLLTFARNSFKQV